MLIHFSKYQGTGNDFILIDNRNNNYPLSHAQIQKLCDRHFGIGADGLILIENTENADFKMIYFNADGKQSTMCGNGGRCAVAYAKQLGIINKNTAYFQAIDGIHFAEILKNDLIRLQMQNVTQIQHYNNDLILNTGSPHYVKIVQNVESLNVFEEGKKIRYSPPFSQHGINVNFLQIINNNQILVRTYERGVESETLSCGTGVTASALVTAEVLKIPKGKINVITKGGNLQVEFEKNQNTYQNIFLIGNADNVFNGQIKIL